MQQKLLVRLALGTGGISGLSCILAAALVDVRPEFSVVASPAEVHLGVIPKETTVRAIAVLSNRGKSLAAIDQIWTSCGCAHAKTSKTSIAPSESCDLTCDVRTGKTAGRLERYAYVSFHDTTATWTKIVAVKLVLVVVD